MYLTLRDRPSSKAGPDAIGPQTGDNVGRVGRGRRTAVGRVGSTVVLLGIVSMFTDISTESVNAVLPLYLVATIGLTPQAFGFVNGLYNGISAAIRLLGGWLADRTDRPKWIASLGYAASALSRVGLLVASGFTAISVIVTGDRLGKGLRTAPRDAIIAASSTPNVLGRAYGVHRSLDSLGAALGPLLAFCILSAVTDGYHTVFVASLGFAVVGLVVLLLFVPDLRPRWLARGNLGTAATDVSPPVAELEPAGGDTAAVLPRVRLRHFASPRLGRLVAAAVLLQLLTVGDSFLYLALELRDRYASNYFALLMVGMNAAYVVLAIPLGRLADRVGRGTVFLAGHAALAVCYVCAAGPLSGPLLTVGCLVALGTYYAATDGTLAALAVRIADTSARATTIATVQTFQALAAFVSSLLVGILWATVGLSATIMWMLPALALAVAVALGLLRGVDRAGHHEGLNDAATVT